MSVEFQDPKSRISHKFGLPVPPITAATKDSSKGASLKIFLVDALKEMYKKVKNIIEEMINSYLGQQTLVGQLKQWPA